MTLIDDNQSIVEIDLKGLNCPMPILKTKQALMKAKGGDILRVLATDPHSEIDFKAYLVRTNHQLLDFTIEDGVFTFLIQKA
ncbi:sulfurtransferase TusA family protein [Ignatzschineria rhizosphaerae]|uniref:Sulfurtransferase TusA family protein n=1 Tax=Ignatzschineria rhizosphaerae TaxID=2923279 RepID=A0ABY3X5G9_9GAMM|nr:sulfurtransferase TusA family protein [Ignatzschineria rhizosphaerae]UNM96994.1 sulfurtransferase TusA family protein [Ignatzschineria rhizosphaerae]